MKKRLQGVEGFSPQLIGAVVSVQVFRKKSGELVSESLEKTVGVLKAYYVTASKGGSFVVDGYSPRQFDTDQNYLEIFVLTEVA